MRRRLRRGGAACLGLLAACGCAASREAAAAGPRAKLARVGLELIGEREAMVPPADRGRFLPCRVIPAFPVPPVPEHPAGYLIVGADRDLEGGAQALLARLEAWQPGELLRLTIRRNPYLQGEPEAYEVEVPVRLRE